MSKIIEISVTSNYVREWGEFEGIREVIQNGIDGQLEFNCPLHISYNATLQKLIVKNVGGSIPKEALLIGFSTKADNDKLIGKFGEGLKLGILALLRAGNTVKIWNDGEIWTPFIGKSKEFNAEVLQFKLTKSKKHFEGVKVLIGNVSPENWKIYRQAFLFLRKKIAGKQVTTSYGDLLLGKKHKGMVFVKGIKVSHYDDLEYGYNFNNVQIDRDRKMVDSYDLESKIGQIWNSVIELHPRAINKVYRMLQNNVRDMKRFSYEMSRNTSTKLLDIFHNKHGQDTLPVVNDSEKLEIEHYGSRGLVSNQILVSVLRENLGDFNSIKNDLMHKTSKVIPVNNLSDQEQGNFKSIIEMITKVDPAIRNKEIEVVEFKGGNVHGQYLDGKIRLNRVILLDRVDLLATLVHEYCHDKGNDAQLSFVRAVENMLAAVAIANC